MSIIISPRGMVVPSISGAIMPSISSDKCIILSAIPPDARLDFIEELLNNKKVGIGGRDIKEGNIKSDEKVMKSAIKYDFDATNTNINLKELTEKLLTSSVKSYGILLYGQSGAGKSLWAQYLAQQLGMNFIKKRASDLMGSLVGQTEAAISDAFKEAREKKAVLVIDEADTFLFDRTKATQMHQVGTVNELLTQMEDHPYPFIMTTNLKDKIDNACFRRFIFKIKFEYMKPENIEAAIKSFFKKEVRLTEEERKELVYLTAGDFKVAKKKMDILENKHYTRENIIKYLRYEQFEKNIKTSSNAITIGE